MQLLFMCGTSVYRESCVAWSWEKVEQKLPVHPPTLISVILVGFIQGPGRKFHVALDSKRAFYNLFYQMYLKLNCPVTSCFHTQVISTIIQLFFEIVSGSNACFLFKLKIFLLTFPKDSVHGNTLFLILIFLYLSFKV